MKMRHSFGSAGALAAAAALSLTHASPARAQTICSDLENPVVVTGSSAVRPFLAKIAGKLKAASPPINVIYKSSGSCDGVANMVNGADDAASKVSGTGLTIYDTNGTPISGGCNTDIGVDLTVDIGASDVFADTCDRTVASDVGDYHGPVQAMTFVVHPSSDATSISAEAAYLVYGFGATDQVVAPWSNPDAIFQRGPSSGTQSMIAKAINVPRAKWLRDPAKNVPANGSTGMLNAVAGANATIQGAAIGVLAADVADANPTVKQLAYKHYGQSCGYLPNSAAGVFDKQNVRDGHYYIWGPLHLYARKGSDGRPASANARKVIDLLEGKEIDVDLIATEAKSGVVPACAMNVGRDTEVGPLYSVSPEGACGCRYVKEATGAVPNSCKECSSDTDCTDASKSKCNFGYCEAK